jgi:hypothetical protein
MPTHRKDNLFAASLGVLDNAAEHGVAVVAPVISPVAAEGSVRLSPKS